MAGYQIQIDLENDLLMVVNNGHLEWTLNTSTGGGYTYTQDGVTSVANTPTGRVPDLTARSTAWSSTTGFVMDAEVLLRGLRHPR